MATCQNFHVEGYAAFKKLVSEQTGKTIFALFCGSKNAQGESWCPDCVTAEPVVEKGLKDAALDSDNVFIHCAVGGRDYWKNQENDFRKDPDLKLKSVPTLLLLNSPKRLEEAQCNDPGMVQMLFED